MWSLTVMYRRVIEDIFLALPHSMQRVFLKHLDVSGYESRRLRGKVAPKARQRTRRGVSFD